jgi:hypothetical protein
MKSLKRHVSFSALFLLTTFAVFGKHDIASYFHLRYTSAPNTDNYFSIRRFILFGKSDLLKNTSLSWRFIYMHNNKMSTDDRIYLQHCYLGIHISSAVNLRLGQFKPPFGWERFVTDFQIIGVERSLVIDRLIPIGSIAPSFARDYGIQLFGDLKKSLLSYEFAATTGNGANRDLSLKNGPLVTGRLTLTKALSNREDINPWRILAQLAFAYRKDQDINFTKQLPGREEDYLQHYQGKDLRINAAINLTHGRSHFAAEYIHANFDPKEQSRPDLNANGFSFQISHYLHQKIQAILKYETFDPNKRIATAHDVSLVTFGVNYYFNHQDGRLMVNYINKTKKENKISEHIFIIQLQYFLFRK